MRKHCTVPGCNQFVAGHGYCSKHYQRWRRHGSPYAYLPEKARDNKRVVFTPKLWNQWLAERFDHPHKRELAKGIAEFRELLSLEQREAASNASARGTRSLRSPRSEAGNCRPRSSMSTHP